MTMTVPIGESVRITTTDAVPEGLDAYAFATEAWQTWNTLVNKRRFSTAHSDDFTPADHDGQPGFIWDGQFRSMIEAKFGHNATDWMRQAIMHWLTSTGNAVNIGGPGRAAKWWLAREWNDVRPANHRSRLPRVPGQTVITSTVPCEWCTRTFGNRPNMLKHQREDHADRFLSSAEFVCPLVEPGSSTGECGYPAGQRNAIGRHLKADHGIIEKEVRDRISDRARARARQLQVSAARPGLTSPTPAQDVSPAEDSVPEVTPPAEPVAAAAAPVPAPPPARREQAPFAAAVAEADRDMPVMPAALHHEAPVPAAGEANGTITAAEATAALQTLQDWVMTFSVRESALLERARQAERKAARADSVMAAANGLLEAMTAS
jgi:hypothetical protein